MEHMVYYILCLIKEKSITTFHMSSSNQAIANGLHVCLFVCTNPQEADFVWLWAMHLTSLYVQLHVLAEHATWYKYWHFWLGVHSGSAFCFLQEFSLFFCYWPELRGAKEPLSHLMWVLPRRGKCFVVTERCTHFVFIIRCFFFRNEGASIRKIIPCRVWGEYPADEQQLFADVWFLQPTKTEGKIVYIQHSDVSMEHTTLLDNQLNWPCLCW